MILLFNANDNGAVFLLGFFENLIFSVCSVECGFISNNFVFVELQCAFARKSKLVLLNESEGLYDTSGSYTFQKIHLFNYTKHAAGGEVLIFAEK